MDSPRIVTGEWAMVSPETIQLGNTMKDSKVCGIATNDIENAYDGNKALKWYETWKGMIRRCYDQSCLRRSPTYIGCTVSDEWKIASKFKEWLDNQHIDEDYQLDKDILVHGNRVYGPETCCFIPRQLNALFNDRVAKRGDYPQGVYFHKATKKYLAKLSSYGKTNYLGLFDDMDEAHEVYIQAKISYCNEVINNLFNIGKITEEIAVAAKKKTEMLYNKGEHTNV